MQFKRLLCLGLGFLAFVSFENGIVKAEKLVKNLNKKKLSEKNSTTTVYVSPNTEESLDLDRWNSASNLVVDQPISQFEYNPIIDSQERGLGNLQGDIAIEGGTFEDNSVKIGSSNIFDPQTGHYLYEFPIPAFMLTPPKVKTGSDNSLSGFNSAVGTISYKFRPMLEDKSLINTKPRSYVKASVGDFGTNSQGVNLATNNILNNKEQITDKALFFELEATRSNSNGTRVNGDNDLDRGTLHSQYASGSFQSDLVLAKQNKNFNWPFLYAPQGLHQLVGSSGIEQENIQSSMILSNSSYSYGNKGESFVDFGGYYKQNKDDYEFDAFNKGLFNPYRHKTKVLSFSVAGTHFIDNTFIDYDVVNLHDEISSTALVFGTHNSASSTKIATDIGQRYFVGDNSDLKFKVGGQFYDSNRFESSVSPFTEVIYNEDIDSANRYFVSLGYASATQNPTYTATKSNPNAGLFRGNEFLDQQKSDEIYTRYGRYHKDYNIESKIFYRQQKDLTDWVYQSSLGKFAARNAANVDVNYIGANLLGSYRLTDLTTVKSGYSYITKDPSYNENIDGSFYALNYAKHRVVFNIEQALCENAKLSFLTELRKQQQNPLRNSTDTKYALSTVFVEISDIILDDLYLNLAIDNLWNENFEEVPGVPGKKRLFVASASFHW